MNATNRCRDCGSPMTWAAQRVQYGRLLRRGIPHEVARRELPRCQKCVTQWLRATGTRHPPPGGLDAAKP